MFTPSVSKNKLVPGNGRIGSKIAIVGDFTDAFDARTLKPFSGPSGTVLEQCLHAGGLIRGECYITNLIKEQTTMKTEGAFFDAKKGTFTEKGKDAVEFLRAEIDNIEANIIVTCGRAASVAIANIRALSTYRGYLFESVGLRETRKVIPTHHPRDSIRGMYTYRHMIACDLKKAKGESTFRELIRPERQLIYNYNNIEEALEWLEYFEGEERVSLDSEVINYEVSCISLSSDPSIACVIPISQGWNEEEELRIWRGIQRVCGNENILKIFQNGMFDMHFWLTRNGIVVKGEVHDTMIAHSCMYPELNKGLGFLGSIYCGSQAYWKDKVNFADIKENS